MSACNPSCPETPCATPPAKDIWPLVAAAAILLILAAVILVSARSKAAKVEDVTRDKIEDLTKQEAEAAARGDMSRVNELAQKVAKLQEEGHNAADDDDEEALSIGLTLRRMSTTRRN